MYKMRRSGSRIKILQRDYTHLPILWRTRAYQVRLPQEDGKKLGNGSFYVSKKSHALIAKLSATIGPKLLINGYIFGQRIIFNLDTGAQVSCIPRKFIPATHLSSMTPAPFELQSYNGTSINVYGSICASFNLGSITIDKAILLVVDDDCSPIIGTPEMKENNLVL